MNLESNPDIKVSRTFKEYYELLNERIKYLQDIIFNFNPYHAEGYSQLVSNYATHDYSHNQSKCSTMPSATIVT